MMRHLRRLRAALVLLLLAALLPASVATAGGGPLPAAIGRQELSINFGDFVSRAELTYPAGAARRAPTVILIPGSGLEDLNADICGRAGGPVLSHIFLDIASFLTPRGFAVLRYDKHYVTGPCRGNVRAYDTRATLQQLLKDAARVLAIAEADPHVDAHRIFLYGWSEGSMIAASLAARHHELAGLIVQGALALPWRATFLYQIEDVGLPYLRTLAPSGRVTAATLRRAYYGPGGLVAREIVSYLAAPGYQAGRFALSPFLDRTHSGVLDINSPAFVAALQQELGFLLSPSGPFPLRFYSAAHTLPTVTAEAPALTMPVLILQGADDANVPPQGARVLNRALAASGNGDHTLEIYPGLGHSLGPAPSVIDDNFRPIAQAPLVDLLGWLARHSRP